MDRSAEIANIIQAQNPDIQLYWNKKRNAIGYWSHSLGRVQVLVSEVIGGTWARMPDLLVNGEPLFKAEDWEAIEVKE